MDGPTLFANLNKSPRLPTPPKDSNSDDDKGIYDTALELLKSTSLPYQIDTPHESPNICTDSHNRSTDKASKRVSFTSTISQINSIDNLENLGCTPPSEKRFPGLKPTRSILKRKASLLSSDPVMSDPPAPSDERDFPTMLEEMMRGLSSSEISPRYDAYFAMNGCLKTYDDVPPRQALIENMSVLAGYIQRDLSEYKPSENPMGLKLVIEALRFATTLLWLDKTRQAAPHAFQIFILNHALNTITAKETSKNLLNQYLYLLSMQECGPKVMTKERACRVLSALQGIEDRFKSKTITANKLTIHKKLLEQEQGRVTMIQKAHSWVEHLFSCLLSPVKEIRIRAAVLGLFAGFSVGAERQPSKVFRDMFNKTSSGEGSGKTIADTFVDRLTSWVGSPEYNQHIPTIWAIGVLFMRSKEKPFDMWKHAGPWLKVLQKCFNASDYKLRHGANLAWTRLIYTVAPDLKTPERTVDLLMSPLESQLKRAADPSKDTTDARKLTYGAYSTLLYYSFRPGADFNALDRYWKKYVVPILFSSKSRQLVEPERACRTLIALFNAKPGGYWDVNRVIQPNLVKPEELPGLDVRWLRARADMIVTNLETLMLKDEWWNGERKDCLFMRVWHSYTEAVGKAGTKEVIASKNTMKAVAKLMSSIGAYLERGGTSTDRQHAYQRLSLMLPATVHNIGLVPFIEKRLTRSKQSFEVFDTPSSGSVKDTRPHSSALLHFLDSLLSQKVESHDTSFKAVLEALLEVALSSATSPLSRIKISREFADSSKRQSFGDPASRRILWDVLTTNLKAKISVKSSDSSNKDDIKAGSVFREVVEILECGIEQIHNIDFQSWRSLLDSLDYEIKAEKGPTGTTTYLVEPLAKFLKGRLYRFDFDSLVELSRAIIGKITWPSLPNEAEKAQRPLGRVQLAKIPGFVPFDHLYSLVSNLLTSTYTVKEVTLESKIQMINTVAFLIEQCPLPCFLVLLEPLQEGLRAWVTDRAQTLNVNDTQSQMLFKTVVDLWDMVLEKIRKLGSHDTMLLMNCWWILIMGFASLHKAIVNLSIAAWNSTFGLEKHIDYPKELREVLLKLSSFVEIQLPGLGAEDGYGEDDIVSLQFADTPEDVEQLSMSSKPSHSAKDMKPPSSRPPPEEAEIAASAAVRTPEPSPATKRIKAAQRTTPRLRHDNSQIEFAAIDSSPSLLGAIDSQLLTDRQKEVKERQSREAAAIFPDVRSTPNPIALARKDSTPRLQLSQRDIVEASGGPKELDSPTLPPTHNMTSFLGSSPTPSQRSAGSRRRSSQLPTPVVSSDVGVEMVDISQEGQDIPSSPPSIVGQRSRGLLFDNDEVIDQHDVEDIEKMEGIEQANGDEQEGDGRIPEESVGNESRRAIADELDNEGIAEIEKELEQTIPESFVNVASDQTSDEVLRHIPQDDLLTTTSGLENAPDQIDQAGAAILSEEYAQPQNQPEEAISIQQQLEQARGSSQVQVVVDRSSDYDDLVSSQIIREMASASQESINTDLPPQADSQSYSSPSAPKIQKKRGRPKRKREEPPLSSLPSTQENNDEEQLLDCITVAQPLNSEASEHFETAMEEEEEDTVLPRRRSARKNTGQQSNPSSSRTTATANDDNARDIENIPPRKKSRTSSNSNDGGIAVPAENFESNSSELSPTTPAKAQQGTAKSIDRRRGSVRAGAIRESAQAIQETRPRGAGTVFHNPLTPEAQRELSEEESDPQTRHSMDQIATRPALAGRQPMGQRAIKSVGQDGAEPIQAQPRGPFVNVPAGQTSAQAPARTPAVAAVGARAGAEQGGPPPSPAPIATRASPGAEEVDGAQLLIDMRALHEKAKGGIPPHYAMRILDLSTKLTALATRSFLGEAAEDIEMG